MNKIDRYLDGDVYAKDQLIDEILDMHNYNITRSEAEFLLQKKYGSC